MLAQVGVPNGQRQPSTVHERGVLVVMSKASNGTPQSCGSQQAKRVRVLFLLKSHYAKWCFSMFNDAIEVLRDVDGSLELYARHYASSTEYQKHKNEVLSLLRSDANNRFRDHKKQLEKNILLAVADALELGHKPYIPMAERD